jgi:hypothetical protein
VGVVLGNTQQLGTRYTTIRIFRCAVSGTGIATAKFINDCDGACATCSELPFDEYPLSDIIRTVNMGGSKIETPYTIT